MPGGSSYKTRVRGLSSQLKFRTRQSVDKLAIIRENAGQQLLNYHLLMMPQQEAPRNHPWSEWINSVPIFFDMNNFQLLMGQTHLSFQNSEVGGPEKAKNTPT